MAFLADILRFAAAVQYFGFIQIRQPFLPLLAGQWTGGSILDPANGTTYRSALWLEDADTLKVRGYWGIFWRTQTWKRVK